VLAALRALARRLGRTPSSHHVAEQAPRIYRELYQHFHSMTEAVVAAGLAPVPFPRKWSQARIVAELRRLDSLGFVLSRRKLIDRGRNDLVNAAAKYFGGMIAARRAAKLPPPPGGRRGKSNWSADEVVAQIKERKLRGLSLASARVPRMLRDAATYHLGGWREAIEKAGLDYDEVRLKRDAYSRHEVLRQLRELAKSQPDLALTALHRHRIKSGIVRWYASVDEALRAARIGNWPRRDRRRQMLTAEETLSRIRARNARKMPMHRTAVERDDPHLERAGERNFGGWMKALRAAGLTPVSSRGQPAASPRRR
jgi:hypothetical protein